MLAADKDIQEFYLGVGEAGRKSFRDVKTYRRKKRWSAMSERSERVARGAATSSLRFGGVIALADVSFDVHRNELFAVIGPNGAGKTSIFNCLNGVYRPQQGTMRLDGVDLVGTQADRDRRRWASPARSRTSACSPTST